MKRYLDAILAASLLLSPAMAQDWLTWGGDPQRTGWAKSETILSKDNVSRLEIVWTAQLDTPPKVEVLSTLTAPLVAGDRVFVVGSDNTVNALDAATGKPIWQRKFPNTLKPPTPANYLCPNTQNATPVIDKDSGTLFVTTSDGKLRGLALANGEDKIPPTDWIKPFARNWSLNLIDDWIYTPVARGCGGAIANFTAINVSDPQRPIVKYYTSTGRPAGAWGRGGLVAGPRGVYGQTADGPYDPAGGKFGNSILALNLKELQLLDSFTPANWEFLNTKDLDLGSASPIVFPFQKWQIVAASAKEGALYLLNANALGGGVKGEGRFAAADHHTPLHESRWGNDIDEKWGRGLWGSMTTWEDPQKERWIFYPMWGPPHKDAVSKFPISYGPAERGSVMGFKLAVENDKPAVKPMWISRDMHVPDPPVVANGVVFVVATGENTRQGGYFPPEVRAKPVSHAILYALDAETGKELYSSGEQIPSWAHFGGLAVSNGRVFFTTSDAKVYAFGLKK
jgi:hypothetical protein